MGWKNDSGIQGLVKELGAWSFGSVQPLWIVQQDGKVMFAP